jgi:hypothetical protein
MEKSDECKLDESCEKDRELMDEMQREVGSPEMER